MKDAQRECPAYQSNFVGRVGLDDEGARAELAAHLDHVFQDAGGNHILIVCVGTDRSTGDAFGPIIGSRLASLPPLSGVEVFGTLDEPVHAVNLVSVLDRIHNLYSEKPFIVAIDACLGRFEHVGHITLERGALRPGAGVNKTLPEFGDVTLTGVVNVSGFMEYFVLQNTRLSVVMRMSDIVVDSLRRSLIKHCTKRKVMGIGLTKA